LKLTTDRHEASQASATRELLVFNNNYVENFLLGPISERPNVTSSVYAVNEFLHFHSTCYQPHSVDNRILFKIYKALNNPKKTKQIFSRAMSILYSKYKTKILINPLECTGNYSATSNNMKLVHWPLVGYFVQRGGGWAGPQPVQASPRCTKCNSPPINDLCTNHRIAV